MKKAPVPTTENSECERLSCLIDGELTAEEASQLLQSLCSDVELRSRWTAFHAVADALHSNEVGAVHSADFCSRVSAAIAREPTVLAPRPPAREVSLRRYLAPGLAVAASVAAIGFVAVPLMRSPAQAPAVQQAAVQSAAPVAPPDEGTRRAAATVASARAMQAYLAAHRELASGVTLPRATPYLRTTAEQGEGR
jgi:negative regulator of sigma E activity